MPPCWHGMTRAGNSFNTEEVAYLCGSSLQVNAGSFARKCGQSAWQSDDLSAHSPRAACSTWHTKSATSGSCDARGPATFNRSTLCSISHVRSFAAHCATASRCSSMAFASRANFAAASLDKWSSGFPSRRAQDAANALPPATLGPIVKTTVASLSRTFRSVRSA